jgi:hypothetical protein
MPLKRDAQGGGTNADGSRSSVYCSHCYLQGEFTMPFLKLEDMQAKVNMKMREKGIPGFMTGLFTRQIPRLNRWKKG